MLYIDVCRGLSLPPTHSFFPVLKQNMLHSSSLCVQLNSQGSLLYSGPCPAWLHPFQSSVTVSELCVLNEDVLVNRSRNDIPIPEQHSCFLFTALKLTCNIFCVVLPLRRFSSLYIRVLFQLNSILRTTSTLMWLMKVSFSPTWFLQQHLPA